MMSYFTKIAVFSMLCFIAEIGLLCADTTTDLSQKLAIIDQKRDGRHTRSQELERECLSLLENIKTAEDSGLVYEKIAYIYSRNGLTQPAKTAASCRLALQYPLSDTLTARMYVSWVCALEVLYEDSLTKADEINLRTEIAGVCMNGLKQIMIHDLSLSTQDLPSVSAVNYVGPEDDPHYQDLLRENRDSLARRAEILKQQDLVMYRNALIDVLTYLSKLDSSTKNEIERLANSTLLDHDKIKEVLSLIDKKLSNK